MNRYLRSALRARSLILVICQTFAVLAPRSVIAQELSASIIGQVTDESGAVLPGVLVSARSPVLQVAAVTGLTDERGEYRLSPLPIGTYSVDYALQGFQAFRHENLRLTAGFVAKIDVIMKVGALEENVTVTGASPIVDVTSTTTSTHFTRETLELTPTSRNGIIGLVAQAPGVRTNLDVGGTSVTSLPSFRAFGQGGEAWAVLEGVVTTALQGNGGNGNYWDYNVVEEARVQTLGNDADMPTRGVQLSAIVKSGGNTFHGSAWWGQISPRFQSNNIDNDLAAQGITAGNQLNKRWDWSGELGGRVVRDKLWFYVAGRVREDLSEILGALKTDGSPATSDQKQRMHTEKLSYQMSPSNRFIGFYQRNHKYDFSIPNRFTAWESRTDSRPISHTYKAEWQTIRGNSFAASAQYGWWDYGDGPRLSFTDAVATFDRGTQQIAGEWFNASTGAADISYNRRHHAKGTATWYVPDLFIGNHELRSGLDYIANDTARENGPRKSSNYRLVFNNGAPLQIETFNYPTTPHQVVDYLGLYAQDSWTIRRRLTVNLGIRYAHDDGHVSAACRDAALPPSDVWSPAACFERVQFKVWNPVSPRIRAAYDVTGDGRTAIKGGWGRFHHMRQVSPEIEQADPLVKAVTTYRWGDPNRNRAYDAGEVNFDLNGPDFVSRSGGSNQIPNSEEKEPKSDEWSMSIERVVVSNFAVRATGLYSRTSDVYRLKNTLRPASAYNVAVTRPDPGEDGRAGTPDDPGTSITYYEYPASLSGQRFELFTLVNDPQATQSYKSFEVAVTKPLSNRWQLIASYSATKKNNPIVNGLNPSEFNSPVYSGDANPNSEIFGSDQTWEWLYRASGAYSFPAQVMVSANFERRSGNPWARTVLFTGGTLSSITLRAEAIGARRLPDINLLDLRLQKALSFTRGQKLTLRANVYNALNINTVTSVTVLSGTSFGRALTIVPPRILELSASYEF